VNRESPGVVYEQDGICMVDMVANELSGATMYGLLNDNSRNGARPRILQALDSLGGVENVALVFGEVDVRYHNDRYFNGDGSIDEVAVFDLLLRYKRFIEHDLFRDGRVTGNVFVYYGFYYPFGESTLLQPGVPMGHSFWKALRLHDAISFMLPMVLGLTSKPVHTICVDYNRVRSMVSDDGVHLTPALVFPEVFRRISEVLLDPPKEVPF
jgi:hypothetical protein